MDFDYDGSEDVGGRIVIYRVVVFGIALLAMFLLGRCTSGGGDVSQEEFDELVASNSEADILLTQNNATIEQLQRELVEARASSQPTTPGGGQPPGSEGPTTDGTSAPVSPTDAPTDANGNRSYEVQPGDTLSTIAEAVYNDPTAFGIIASANGLSGESPLQVGQTLIIPPNPDQ